MITYTLFCVSLFYQLFNTQRINISSSSFRHMYSNHSWLGGTFVIESQNCPSGGSCIALDKKNHIYRYFSTESYYNITVQLSLRSFGICELRYITGHYNHNSSSWKHKASYSSNGTILHFHTLLHNASDTRIVGIDFSGSSSMSNEDRCWINDVYITGVSLSTQQMPSITSTLGLYTTIEAASSTKNKQEEALSSTSYWIYTIIAFLCPFCCLCCFLIAYRWCKLRQQALKNSESRDPDIGSIIGSISSANTDVETHVIPQSPTLKQRSIMHQASHKRKMKPKTGNMHERDETPPNRESILDIVCSADNSMNAFSTHIDSIGIPGVVDVFAEIDLQKHMNEIQQQSDSTPKVAKNVVEGRDLEGNHNIAEDIIPGAQ